MSQPELRSLLDATLSLPTSAIPYRMGASLSAAFAGHAVLETRDVDFDPWRFERDGHASMEWRQEVHSQRTTSWHRTAPHLSRTRMPPGRACAGTGTPWTSCVWSGAKASRGPIATGWSPRPAIAEAFLSAVCAWCHLPRRELLVFGGNCWSKSRSMWASVEQSSFDDLDPRRDAQAGDRAATLERFLGARAEYARYGVPWKRGILFVGPPGNGKTHCLRAAIRLLDVPCLYVQSLQVALRRPRTQHRARSSSARAS